MSYTIVINTLDDKTISTTSNTFYGITDFLNGQLKNATRFSVALWNAKPKTYCIGYRLTKEEKMNCFGGVTKTAAKRAFKTIDGKIIIPSPDKKTKLIKPNTNLIKLMKNYMFSINTL